MEGAAFVRQGLSILSHPMLAGAQLPEILSCGRHDVLVQLKHYPASLVVPKRRYVKVHLGAISSWRILHTAMGICFEGHVG